MTHVEGTGESGRAGAELPDRTSLPGHDRTTLLGRGRDADVYALDETRVLRRYRDRPVPDSEVRIMRYLREAGYPVPEVFGVSDGDLIMERLTGEPMMAAMLAGGDPAGHGAALAALHNRLHAVPAPEWLGEGAVLHLDLHPGNVMLTDRGPVVFDWSNATAGDPALDVADTVVLLRVAAPPEVDPALIDAARAPLIEGFLAATDHDPEPVLRVAIRERLANPYVTAAESRRLRDWLAELD
ncbi:tRNA A-37 threonylcarbamoyl transferase component Bud32 [Stackebrandtia albiflava]|uniref:tRNA A-37 threonylcarbamoyl transferase component Bud32 n=1 Tax=Stackebrandtia albiflava TaxID=406432 RepID=A0A562UQ11_9ACTN|nr:phosphotransferase [Stackebrandtia albiflava]TWJ07686.1 tRNA A-37 threonylcarbamoyl transferase component Bud32 [Stackebrandtia albiflava]